MDGLLLVYLYAVGPIVGHEHPALIVHPHGSRAPQSLLRLQWTHLTHPIWPRVGHHIVAAHHGQSGVAYELVVGYVCFATYPAPSAVK